MDESRRMQRFYRRLFRTLSDHQRQLDELRQSRTKVESSQRYPNVEFSTLTLGETVDAGGYTAESRHARYGSPGDYGYGSYSTGETIDTFDRSTVGSGALNYVGTNTYTTIDTGFGEGRAIEGDGVLITDGENVGGDGAKATYHFRHDGTNQNRKFLFNTVSETQTFFAEVRPGFLTLARRDNGSRYNLANDDITLDNGWHMLQVNHSIGGTEVSLQRIMPFTETRTNVGYCTRNHDNPVPDGDDAGIDTTGGVYDHFVFA